MAELLFVYMEVERDLKRQRVFRDRTRQLDTLSDDEMISRYRLPRLEIIELCKSLTPTLQRYTERSKAMSVETQVLVTLRYLAKGGFLMENGDLHGISESSTSRAFHAVVTAIIENVNTIVMPNEERELRNVREDFYQIAGFPRVIGAIDGTLVPIKRPDIDVEAAYVCRKGYHAINVQAICDANLRFLNVVAKWPGSSHDSMILSNSDIGQAFELNPPRDYLLGDSGYACRPWLMTPLTNPTSPSDDRYNRSHAKTRNTIERAFGVLKSRFRCLHKSTGCPQFSSSKSVNIIMACFKLHNYCLSLRLPPPPFMEDDNDDNDNDDDDWNDARHGNAFLDGQRMRRRLIEHSF